MTNTDIHNLSEKVEELWNGWELRAMMLLSFSLQFFLIILGNRRKYTAGFWFGTLVWLAYVSADWVATVSLGILARSQGDSGTSLTNQNLIPVFWAPILLAHLGGPDTITAYSVEDNKLWLRRFLELLAQLGVAFYALFRLWRTNSPTFVAIPIFVAGIIKCAERVQVLRLASSKKFRISVSKEMSHKKNLSSFQLVTIEFLRWRAVTFQARFLHEAHFLFQMLKSLFTHDFLSYPHHMATYLIMRNKNGTDAFQLVEVELGFLYDVLYTKATICFSRIILRFISFLSFCSALASFCLATNKHAHSKIDMTVSYVLLVGAVFLEIYSVIMLLFSDWSLLSLSMPDKPIANSFHRVIVSSRLQLVFRNQKRWSESLAQKNIITDFLEKEANKNCIKKLLWKAKIEKREMVGNNLKENIFNQLLQKRTRIGFARGTLSGLREVLAERGARELQRQGCLDKFGNTVVDFEFHSSLLTWHIATTLCFYADSQRNGNDVSALHQSWSKSISDYMFYLLVDCPLMLPEGNAERRYEDTKQDICDEVLPAPQDIGRTTLDVCNNLLHSSSIYERNVAMSSLPSGCKLAGLLNSLETEPNWSNERKWEMICQVWVEILTYASVHCQWKEHAQALTRGGELLTYVRLLMDHLGLSEQCRFENGLFDQYL